MLWGSLSAVVLGAISAAAAGAPSNIPEDMVDKRNHLRTHSLHLPYVDSDLQNRWWDFGEDTIVNTNRHMRLTQDRQSEKGWLWSRLPLSVSNWQMEVEFKVDGKASSMYGDGFAIWITEDRAVTGPVFGSKDNFKGLGIFFDTYANSRHSYSLPRVTAMLGDGRTAYDHNGDNAGTELAGCSINFRRRDVPTKARMTYLAGKGFQLSLQTDKEGQWTTCFIKDIQLPPAPYIGFSAATGEVTDNHDIIAVAAYSATLKYQYQDSKATAAVGGGGRQTAFQAASYNQNGGRAPPPSSSGGVASWFLFLLKVIGVLAFVAFAVAAYRTYSAQQKKRPSYY